VRPPGVVSPTGETGEGKVEGYIEIPLFVFPPSILSVVVYCLYVVNAVEIM